jgi:hypothetical protein
MMTSNRSFFAVVVRILVQVFDTRHLPALFRYFDAIAYQEQPTLKFH